MHMSGCPRVSHVMTGTFEQRKMAAATCRRLHRTEGVLQHLYVAGQAVLGCGTGLAHPWAGI